VIGDSPACFLIYVLWCLRKTAIPLWTSRGSRTCSVSPRRSLSQRPRRAPPDTPVQRAEYATPRRRRRRRPRMPRQMRRGLQLPLRRLRVSSPRAMWLSSRSIQVRHFARNRIIESSCVFNAFITSRWPVHRCPGHIHCGRSSVHISRDRNIRHR
jgi:hypothetical protein